MSRQWAGPKARNHVDAIARGCRPSGLPLLAAAALAGAALSAADPSVWDGVYTAEQTRRGETAYLTACASCHGTSLEGGDMTPALVGGAFTSNWNDLTVGDLFERIRITMPLDNPGRLSRQQNADVIAFMLKANGWPAGTGDLASDLAQLKQIRIEAVRPLTQER
jgi:mono/diheme cytochrome c family protein